MNAHEPFFVDMNFSCSIFGGLKFWVIWFFAAFESCSQTTNPVKETCVCPSPPTPHATVIFLTINLLPYHVIKMYVDFLQNDKHHLIN